MAHLVVWLWRHPALWPLGARLVLLTSLALVLAILVMHGLSGSWHALQDQPNTPSAQTVQDMQQSIQTLQAQQASLTRTLAQQRWPEARLPQVLQDIQRIARQHSIALEMFKPLPLRTHTQFAELPVQVKLQATHAALLGFLRDLSQLARPVAVSELHLQTRADQPWLSMEAKFSVLRLLTPQEQAQRKQAAPVLVSTLWPEPAPDISLNPFDAQRLSDWLRQQHPAHEPAWLASERTRTPQWLERFALDQLQLVGQLMQDGQRVALIKAAQRIHQVRVGHYLGPHGGRVLSIEEQALTLREIFQDEAGLWQQRHVVLKLERSS